MYVSNMIHPFVYIEHAITQLPIDYLMAVHDVDLKCTRAGIYIYTHIHFISVRSIHSFMC